MENDELCAHIARVKDLLSGQRKILDAMPERDLQVYILDVLDALVARRIQRALPRWQRLHPSLPPRPSHPPLLDPARLNEKAWWSLRCSRRVFGSRTRARWLMPQPFVKQFPREM